MCQVELFFFLILNLFFFFCKIFSFFFTPAEQETNFFLKGGLIFSAMISLVWMVVECTTCQLTHLIDGLVKGGDQPLSEEDFLFFIDGTTTKKTDLVVSIKLYPIPQTRVQHYIHG